MSGRMRIRLAALGAILALVGTACGGGSSSEAGSEEDVGELTGGDLIDQGDIQLDDSEIATASTTDPPGDDGGGGAAEGSADTDTDGEGGGPAADTEDTEDTIPQNEEEEGAVIDNLFSAMRVFTECLEGEGHSFIGAPSSDAEPDDPINDSGYLTALGKCAALSDIQNAFQTFSEASDNLTSDEILERNKALVIWADCMQGRGWEIGALEPDSKGLLEPTDLGAPEGESLLDSNDLQDCATRAQEEVAEVEGGEE